MRRRVAVLLGFGALLGAVPAAEAAQFEVTNLDQSGAGSLRDAVVAAENTTDIDLITFRSGLAGSISVPTTIGITRSVTIQGPGPKQIRLVGAGTQPIFTGQASAGTRVSLSGLTLTGGSQGIYSTGMSFSLRNMVLTGNNGGPGAGGISTAAQPQPGNPFPDYGPGLSVVDSTIYGNSSPGGGGIYVSNGTTAIRNSTISGNSTYGGGTGGGVIASGDLTIQNSTITDNKGGGVNWMGQQYCSLADCIPAEFVNRKNEPDISNSILADNPTGDLFSGNVSARFSLIEFAYAQVEDPTPGAGIAGSPTSNVLGKGAQLGPLADNGGATPTHAPAPTSPSVDQGYSSSLPTDQRGNARTFDALRIPNSPVGGGDGTDIGSVELEVEQPKCKGRQATLYAATGRRTVGTPERDVIVGSNGKNRIKGRGGDDLICAEGGRDKVFGGKGRDTLIGGKGEDMLVGGQGKDRLKGGPGKDAQKQ